MTDEVVVEEDGRIFFCKVKWVRVSVWDFSLYQIESVLLLGNSKGVIFRLRSNCDS